MSAKVQSLIRTQQGGGTPRDPDRLQLAIAISAADQCRRALDAAKASVGRSHRFVDLCEERLALATAAGIAARDNLARRVTASAVDGTSIAPDSSMRAARLDEADCEDSLAAAKAALAATEALLEEPTDALRHAEKRVTAAAKTVLSRAIEPAIADVVRLKASLVDALGALHLLQTACVESWPPNSEWTRLRGHLLVEARGGVCFEIEYEGNRGAERWAKYAEELKTSADAEPPT